MAEIDDKLNELTSQLGNLSTKFSKMGDAFSRVSSGLSTLSESLSEDIAKSIRNFGVMSARAEKAGKLIDEFGDVMSLPASRLSELGKKLNVANIDKLLQEWENSGANEEDLNAIRKKLRIKLDEQLGLIQKQIDTDSILQETLMGSALLQSRKKLELLTEKTNTVNDKMIIVGDILLRVGNALTGLRDKVYALQRQLGTTFPSAVSAATSAIYNQVRSLLTSGPILSFQDTIDTINAFQKEFGGLLTADAARRIAQSAKDLGVSAEVYLKAQRAFLVVGGDVTRTTFITQFRNAGLTAAQALNFAANNANLVAIAGTKYANELARAAANAQKIGVGLEKTEQFADSLVGDFEGALERFSELRAMGVEVDFNRLAQVAATGTPEEVFGELSKEMGGNRALLENIQKNRFLKVAIERDLGLSIADVTRLAAGGAAKAPEATEAEKQRTLTTTLIERAGAVIGGIGLLTTFIGLNTAAIITNTTALMKSASIKSFGDLFKGGGAGATISRLGLGTTGLGIDRKSTRLNSSHVSESRMPSSA